MTKGAALKPNTRQALESNGHCAGIVSEEMEEVYNLPAGRMLIIVLLCTKIGVCVGKPRGNYLVVSDPLDGSSNINVNVSVGTIFS